MKSLRGVSGLYQIRCAKNGMVYIGQSKNLQRRFGEHRSALSRGVHRNGYLQSDYDKYGSDYFKYEVISIDVDNMDAAESELIAQARERGLCYNVFSGGHKGAQPTEEWRKKVSEGNLGKTVASSTRDKISKATTNQWKDTAFRNKMISSAKSQWTDPAYREKVRLSRLGKGNDGAAKLTADDVRIARIRYNAGCSPNDLAKEFGVTYCTMLSALKRRSWKHID